MRSDRRLTGDAGLSLIEATIVLATATILAAILAPNVRSYVQAAQQASAKKDVETIGSALAQFLTDTGESWFLRDGNGAAATNPPSHLATNRVDLLVSDGNIPAVYTARSTGGTDWSAAVDNAAVQKLEYYLITNTPSNTAANAYRPATSMTSGFDPASGAQFNADHAWRGAYVPGPIGADPWGNRYAVNVEFLARAESAAAWAATGNVNDVVVLSAGNNGLIETRFDVDGVTNGNDVFYVMAGATR